MKLVKNSLLILGIVVAMISCRNAEPDAEEKAETEIENLMNDPENKVEIKDGGDKVKIETPEGDEIKVKKEDGDYKKKVDKANGKETKLKIDNGEVKVKTDH